MLLGMAKREYCLLYLTCENTVAAGEIVNMLLSNRLVVCVKQMSVSSNYWNEGKIEQSSEVLLIMESAIDLFDQVEQTIAKLHTYKTFVLESTSITRVSKSAEKWMNENLAPIAK
jgi:periplasmic divalent cation tolerance protein